MAIGIERLSFIRVCRIGLKLSEDGQIPGCHDPAEHDNEAHQDEPGEGPSFDQDFPDHLTKGEGVFAILCDSALRYMGYSAGLRKEQIDWTKNGAANALLLHELKKGAEVLLYFHRTKDGRDLARFLSNRLNPGWNLGGDRVPGPDESDEDTEPDDLSRYLIKEDLTKYDPLSRYLRSSPHQREILSFAELESIIQAPTPDQIKTWRSWWQWNTRQAAIWALAGWEVVDFQSGDHVVFDVDPSWPDYRKFMVEQLPEPNCSRASLASFARTLDAPRHWGSLTKAIEVFEGALARDLDTWSIEELATSLYMWQRYNLGRRRVPDYVKDSRTTPNRNSEHEQDDLPPKSPFRMLAAMRELMLRKDGEGPRDQSETKCAARRGNRPSVRSN